MDEKNGEKLQAIIKQMREPRRGLPFSNVIEALSGFTIIPFNGKDAKDIEVLAKLKIAAKDAGEEINKIGIYRPRPNEVGNDVEEYVLRALEKIGYKAGSPKTGMGKNKSTGYPDLYFIDDNGRTHYLECKTFSIKNLETTFRSFYLSPSDEFKITQDAHHFLISYEIVVAGTKGQDKVYKCKSWKLLTLDSLNVDIKYEFNSDNKRLYSKNSVLTEGNFQI